MLVELEGDRIVINTEYRQRELTKQVPGVKYDRNTMLWTCPVSWAACVQLRGVFQEDLEIGPKLTDWSWREYTGRVQPCLQLRDAEDVSDGLGFELYRQDDLEPRQRAGVAFLVYAQQALLADGMGSGKTVQLICALETLASLGQDAFPALIVCPNSMVYKWVAEWATWAPHRKAVAVKGGAVKRRKILEEGADVFVINWEGLRGHTRLAGYGSIRLTDKDKELKELNHVGLKSVVADEAHRGKSPSAQQTRAWWWLSWQAQFRYAATGTPVANSPEDAWSIMHGVAPREYPSKGAFIDRYALQCTPPDSMVWMADGTFKPIGNIREGDLVQGFSTKPLHSQGTHPRVEPTRVRAVHRGRADLVRVITDRGKTFLCTPNHNWLAGWDRKTNNGPRHMRFSEPRKGVLLRNVVEVPPQLPDSLARDAAWLAGVYDGEGSHNAISQSLAANPEVHAEIGRVLTELDIRHHATNRGYKFLGGRDAYARFLHYCRPVKRHHVRRERLKLAPVHPWAFTGSLAGKGRPNIEKIVKVEPAGEGDVVGLHTDLGTYVVHGYASHNSWNNFGGMTVVGLRGETREEFFKFFDARFIRRPTEVVIPNIAKKLPPQIRPIDLLPKQRKAYDQLRKEMLTQLDSGVLTATNPLTKMTRLLQLASAYGEVDAEGNLLLSEPSCKLDALDELYEELGDEPIAVFAESKQLINLAATRLNKHKIPYGLITGDVNNAAERTKTEAAFQAGDIRVILLTMGAGGEGLTLTATCYPVYLQRSASLIKNLQSVDRTWRRGQTRDVQPIIFKAVDTIEDRIEQIGLDKELRAEEINRDQLRRLLS